MLTPSHEKMSINQALESGFFASEDGSSFGKNYRIDSVDKTIENIIEPILESLKAQNLSGSHVRSIKGYKKDLKKVQYEDHTEAANRALGDRGISGETGEEAIALRAKKQEWRVCLNISERLGKHLAEMLVEDPRLGEILTVQTEKDSASYPIVIELLKSINAHLSRLK